MKIRLGSYQKRRPSIIVVKLYSDKATHPVKNYWSITVFICDQDCFAGSKAVTHEMGANFLFYLASSAL